MSADDAASAWAASVVIPARDAEPTIGDAVRAIRDQRDGRGRPLEVIVVDDGSRDGTARVAAEAGATVVTAAGDGPARARNLGVAAARAATILFTDADCCAQPGFAERLLQPLLDDPGVAGTKGAYVTGQRSLTARFVQQEYEERYARMAERESIDFVDTYACVYRRDVFEQAGGFDERYRVPSTEDQELSFRIAATGARLLFVPAARTAHLHADTPLSYVRKKLKIGRYKVATLRAHPGKAVDDSHTPLSLKLQLLLAPLVLFGAAASLVGEGAGLDLHWSRHAVLWTPAALFLLSTTGLALQALRRDAPVGVLTPAFCFARAWALGLGVVAGLLLEAGGRGVAAEHVGVEAGSA